MEKFDVELYATIVKADEDFSDTDAMARHIVYIAKHLAQKYLMEKPS